MARKIETNPTLKDLADAAGISVAAVSKVLNNREGVSATNRARVARVAAEIGYRGRGGRLTAQPRLDTAVVATLAKYVTNDAFYSEILDGLVRNAKEEGLALDLAILTGTDLSSPDYAPLLEANGGGILLVGVDDPDLVTAIHKTGRPTVLVNGMDRRMRVSSVSPDYNFGGWLATQHLLDLGHRDIVHVTHVYRESLRRRLLGFRDALEEAGIAFTPEQHVLDVGAPDMLTISCRERVSQWIAARRTMPTAFFCANDMVALGVMQAVVETGRSVPRDVSVIGFDGLKLGEHAAPPLTTMAMDAAQMARTAIQLLQSVHESRAVRRVALGVSFLERDSTAPRR
jgi:DNA-binding LacI/PurR family transcriptional regulator